MFSERRNLENVHSRHIAQKKSLTLLLYFDWLLTIGKVSFFAQPLKIASGSSVSLE